MKNNIAALFDLDGVIIDTESQYDVFWKRTGEKYRLGIENFERIIKGTVLPDIMTRYFSRLSEEERRKIVAANHAFEMEMEMRPIPGAPEFLTEVKNAGIQTALVTSSDDAKLNAVFNALPIRSFFDTVVSADRVTRGKPDPMGYLLAARDLNISPQNCFVFEDSFNGIAAGNAAGMKVIGLATTHPAESIRDKVWKVIPDFRGFSLALLPGE